MKRLPPGLALVLIAPALGELVSGHMPPADFFNPITFVILALPYGLGALICRETIVRLGKGWPSLVLLAVAYGVYEEAVVVRSVFNPSWGELGSLTRYDHVAGINWTYSQILIHFHAVISIGSSVLLAEVIYPRRRGQSWVGNKTLALCATGLALWLPAGWLMTDYRPPAALYAAGWLLLIALIAAAVCIPAPEVRPARRTAPRPLAFFLLGLTNTSAFFLLVFMTPEMAAPPPLFALVAGLAILDGIALFLLVRWSDGGRSWTDRRRLAWISGQLGFLIFSCLLSDFENESGTWEGKSLVAAAAIFALWRISRRAGRTDKSQEYQDSTPSH